jgi:hypothetical protein
MSAASGLVVLALTLGSCSDYDPPVYTPPAQFPPSPPSPVTGSPFSIRGPGGVGPETGGGIWYGKLSRQGHALDSVTCLITETGALACALLDPSYRVVPNPYPLPTIPTAGKVVGGARGILTVVSATEISGSGTFYTAADNLLANGSSVVADFTITGGSLRDHDAYYWSKVLELTIESLGDELTLSADFDHYYWVLNHAPGGALRLAEGVYGKARLAGEEASLVIDHNQLLSQTASGCVGNGELDVINTALNGYRMSIAASGCPGLDGEYEGMAFVLDFQWVNGYDLLLFLGFNDTRFLWIEASKP